jgi:hypothetical protein
VDRPLWRIVLPILLLSFAAHRAGAAAIAWSAVPRALALASGAEAAAALLAALGLFFGGRPATVGVAAFGVVVAAHALLLVWLLGAPALFPALSRILAVAIGTGFFLWVVRTEISPPG